MPSPAQRFAFVARSLIVAPQAVKIEVVSKDSALRKSALRKLGAAAGRNRTLRAILSAVRITLRSFTRALHQLWLEVTGTVFLTMAVIGGTALVREYLKYTAGRTTASRLAIAICFTAAFAWFGLSSFWRVHRKTRP